MKIGLKNIASKVATALFVAALATACSTSEDIEIEAGVGVMWSVNLKSTSGENLASTSSATASATASASATRVSTDEESDYTKALENSVMKIYDAEERLVRRYEPLSEAPATIYLTEGDYTVTVLAGESLSPAESTEDFTFYGEGSFSITAASSASVAINCKMLNNAVTVKFESSIADNIEEGYSVVVAPASEISETILADTYYHKKVFTESGVVYFIQPDAETNLAWQFVGTRKLSDEVITRTGLITDVVAGESNCLTFSYDKELIISTAFVTVDTSTEDHNDIFEFSPQPTVNGSNFDISSIQIADGRDFEIKIAAIYDLADISINYADSAITPLVGGVAQEVDGASYSITDATSGVLTIDASYFENIGAGGDQTIIINVSDIKASKSAKEFYVTTSGVTSLSNVDLWSNSATINATLVDPTMTQENTKVEYRTKGSEAWSSFSLTAASESSYTASATASWNKATNGSGLTYYTPAEGFFPNTEYECRLVVDGVARPAVSFTTENTTQSIPSADLNSSSLPCWGSSSSGSTSWCSGNNTFVSSLCTQGSRGDSSACAYLKATEAAGTFAAGNLIYGQFTFNGIIKQTGTVSFGQAFTWSVRPKSFKLRYSATVGQDSMTSPTGVSYSHDRARVFFAIVDWSGRHDVTAGSGSPSGVWDPETESSVSEGQIIGYASMYIDESTDSNMYDLELPIYYYDTVTKPSKSISLVISCVTSAYGDYLTGSTDSRLWVDDFAFGY